MHGQWLGGVIVSMLNAKPKRTVAQRVESRLAAGLCLLCDEPEYKRGLCSCHYSEFRTERTARPLEERAMFEAAAIREGKIATSRQGRRTDKINAFADL